MAEVTQRRASIDRQEKELFQCRSHLHKLLAELRGMEARGVEEPVDITPGNVVRVTPAYGPGMNDPGGRAVVVRAGEQVEVRYEDPGNVSKKIVSVGRGRLRRFEFLARRREKQIDKVASFIFEEKKRRLCELQEQVEVAQFIINQEKETLQKELDCIKNICS